MPSPLSAKNIADTPASRAFISVSNLFLTIRGKSILSHISISMNRNEITAIIGPSGCGKSSFLMCLNRLMDLTPGARVQGQIRVGSWDVMNPDIDIISLRRCVGMIFQKPNPFPLSIKKNLEMPLREKGVTDKSVIEAAVEHHLREVGLWNEVKDRLYSPALALSGGQQQRLCIARALMLTPGVLLFDEPCSALDPLSSATVEELIVRLKEDYTVVVVTHNLGQARRISDNVALFWVQEEAGRLVESGPTAQIFESPQEELTAAYVHGIKG